VSQPKKFDRNGFNRKGVHQNGTRFDEEGYDKRGFNQEGLHRNGTRFDKYGFDCQGFDRGGLGIIETKLVLMRMDTTRMDWIKMGSTEKVSI
jgi:hypothetical protein